MKTYTVDIDDFIPHGTVFSVGVHHADKGIREGDEVVICHGDDVRAVGVALTDGEEMQESTRGKAVRVRHHKG
jgi:archaeosine synthase